MSSSVVLSHHASPRRCVWHRPVDEYGDGDVYYLQVDLEDEGLVAHGWSALDGRAGSIFLPSSPAWSNGGGDGTAS